MGAPELRGEGLGVAALRHMICSPLGWDRRHHCKAGIYRRVEHLLWHIDQEWDNDVGKGMEDGTEDEEPEYT